MKKQVELAVAAPRLGHFSKLWGQGEGVGVTGHCCVFISNKYSLELAKLLSCCNFIRRADGFCFIEPVHTCGEQMSPPLAVDDGRNMRGFVVLAEFYEVFLPR